MTSYQETSRTRIAVLATCFNRRETTIKGLTALQLAAGGIDYQVYLVDDGSKDGTGDAVKAQFPSVRVIDGTGSLFWNGGMRKAWQQAIPGNPQYYLWWNDDLELLSGSLVALLAFQKFKEAEYDGKVITVGKVADPATGKITYGGYRRRSWISRLAFSLAPNDGKRCITMNGNCVLIPAQAVAHVGIHSERFTHDSGDIDYGLRATKAGYHIFQSPDVVGYTAYNDAFDLKRSRLSRSNWRFILRDPKGLPVNEWLYFCRTHGGWLWPVNFLYRYIKLIRLRA